MVLIVFPKMSLPSNRHFFFSFNQLLLLFKWKTPLIYSQLKIISLEYLFSFHGQINTTKKWSSMNDNIPQVIKPYGNEVSDSTISELLKTVRNNDRFI